MGSKIWNREEIESPCINVCQIHPATRLCTGCFRTPNEITLWSRMSAEERREIMDELPARGAEFRQRRGGRARNRS